MIARDKIRYIGEPTTVPTAPAVANAVYDAVGVRLHDLPLTPERVYWGLKGKASQGRRDRGSTISEKKQTLEPQF